MTVIKNIPCRRQTVVPWLVFIRRRKGRRKIRDESEDEGLEMLPNGID